MFNRQKMSIERARLGLTPAGAPVNAALQNFAEDWIFPCKLVVPGLETKHA